MKHMGEGVYKMAIIQNRDWIINASLIHFLRIRDIDADIGLNPFSVFVKQMQL